MLTREDIESFLDRLSADGAIHSEVKPGIWNVQPAGALNFGVVVHYSPPVLVLRVKVMDLPAGEEKRNGLARRLLEMNATDLLHGSYGIQNNSVILTEALELEHLDFEEFLAAYESITLALASHIRELASYSEAR
ncbi:MAG TPA: YbjN domain-containing protein [Gemmatimonadaceae bacterium]|nr:YbjN domain-containing protein [Gemmatimonadaceae bacterium]